MPADLTERNGEHLFAANVRRGHPWHRLGAQVTEDMTKAEALTLVQADDTVTATPLYTLDPLGNLVPVETHVAVLSDIHGPMFCVRPSYEIQQRSEMLDLAYEIAGLDENGRHIDTIGNLGENAEIFFAYIRVPELVIDPHGIADTIERGLFVATSYDTTLQNTIGYSNIRVVCSNTLQMALPGLQQAIKVRHTKYADERMRTAARALQYVGAVEQATIEQAEKMLTVPGTTAANKVMEEFWPLKEEISDAHRTRRERERSRFQGLLKGPNNLNTDKVGDNGWAVYNAIVEYYDHARPVRNTGLGQEEDMKRAQAAVLPGTVADTKLKASKIILSLAA